MSNTITKHILSVIFSFAATCNASQAQDVNSLYPQKDIKASIGGNISISGSSTTVPSGNYSGISWIGGNKYIVISDKKVGTEAENTNSWQTFSIVTDEKGKPTGVKFEGSTTLKNAEGNEISRNDTEGIVFVPKANSINGLDASEGGTVFIAAESDQKVLEYDMEGKRTGRELAIPEEMGSSKIFGNYGFEALAYSPERGEFWTTTEQGLKADVTAVSSSSNAVPTYLRIVRFGKELNMDKQYAYKTDAPTANSTSSKYAFGVPELTALPDGTLIVCEREFYVGDEMAVLNSFVNVKLYRAYPEEVNETSFNESLKDLPEGRFMKKVLLTSHKTGINNIANYEGMCLGEKTQDGSYNLLMINDSQNRYKGVLGEYIMNVTLTEENKDADSIEDTTSKQTNATTIFNTNGVRMTSSNQSRNGIVIANGKKYATNN